ncbi:uncharacterized protein JCM6883_005789 [Sporobolomyces salmoneus]|uniref:uncharacterized protein n=1 Tax=Sporobolomyces salmoneus TaxID=183962 RepID=UPI00317671F6
MSGLVQFDHVDPFKQARLQEYGGPSLKGKGGRDQPIGLAVQYEGSSPFERKDIRIDDMGWDKNEIPIPRNKSKRNTRGPRDTRMSFRPEPSRIDSVLDVYAELYADEGGAEDEEYQPPQSYYSSNRQEDLAPFQSIPQPIEPWDERGKTGLYGGGGRGADDRETGWVRGYSIGSSVPSVGFEEDLRFDEQESEDTPRSSSETAQSGSYPVTPTSSQFPVNQPSSAKSYDSPPEPTRVASSSTHSRTPSTLQNRFRAPERPRRTDSPARDAPLSPGDLNLLRKKSPQPSSLSSPSIKQATTATPSRQQTPTPAAPTPSPKRSNSIFKRYGRSKKQPPISNPIVPQGFVESLGMKTFTLTPGCKAPVFDKDQIPAPSSSSSVPQTPDQPSVPLNQPPRPRDSSPVRPTAPRSSSSVRSRNTNGTNSPARPPRPAHPPVHSYDSTAHRQSDVYPHEAMARLSLASHSSAHSVPSAPHPSAQNPSNHRQFFDQLRHEEEDSLPFQRVASGIPSQPLRPAREPIDFEDRSNWESAAAVSREDERGHAVQYDPRGNELEEDSAASSYSEDFGGGGINSRRPSMAANQFGRDVSSYYGGPEQQQQNSRETRYDLAQGGGGGYDRSSQVELLDDEEGDYSRYGAGPIKPLNVKRTPPLPLPTSSTSSAGLPRPLAQFNRGKGIGGGEMRNSTIDPLSSFAGVKKQHVKEGPAIGSTGFRNPFG